MKKDSSKEKTVISISTGSLLKIVLFGFLVLALIKLYELLLVLLTAIVLATFVEGGVQRFRKYRMGRTFSVVVIFGLLAVFVAGMFYLFVPLLVNELSSVVTIVSKYIPQGTEIISQNNLSDANAVISSFSDKGSLADIAKSLQVVSTKISGGFLNVLSSAFGGLVNFALIFIISFYLSIQEKGIEKFLRIVTPLKNEAYIIDLWGRSQRKIGLWIRGQLVLGLIIAVLTYLGLAIFGVPNALLLALLTGVFELIPFGIFLAVIPALSFAFIEGGISLALMVAGFYLIVQQFESYLIQPLVVKKVIGISPLVVILSVLIGAILAGFWGLILAVPVAVSLIEYMNDVEKEKIGELESR
ncbi:MAG: AI-2E family transporter [Candidatus Pacebacteria bacterium]|nr:AI-2E family transporter [Candidatus Paceibacterota bacterium]MBP9780687.1 AI-2E family transporter [Candidatus Paceibacterota bacterium]